MLWSYICSENHHKSNRCRKNPKNKQGNDFAWWLSHFNSIFNELFVVIVSGSQTAKTRGEWSCLISLGKALSTSTERKIQNENMCLRLESNQQPLAFMANQTYNSLGHFNTCLAAFITPSMYRKGASNAGAVQNFATINTLQCYVSNWLWLNMYCNRLLDNIWKK